VLSTIHDTLKYKAASRSVGLKEARNNMAEMCAVSLYQLLVGVYCYRDKSKSAVCCRCIMYDTFCSWLCFLIALLTVGNKRENCVLWFTKCLWQTVMPDFDVFAGD